jgi:arylsulfatase A-like enzyme
LPTGHCTQNFTPLRGGHPTQGQGWRAVPSSAIRKGDWKLIERFETSNIELYNIKDDISEQNDLTTHHPEKATELLTDLKLWQRDTQAIIPKDPNTLYDAGYELSIAQS